ncbi:MAG: response regulator transcription factor [Candidatus Binataceae bacterium]
MRTEGAAFYPSIRENGAAKVAVIDDDASALKSLTRMVATGGYEPLAFASARDFLFSSGCSHVSCVVSDLRMPEFDGLDLQRAVRERLPHLSLIFVTGAGDVPATVTAMKAGAVDFLEKPITCDVLLEAIGRAIHSCGESMAAQAVSRSLRIGYEALTPREREVLSLVSAGLLNKQIAAHIGIAEKTVKQHRGQVMRKMRADSLADLVIMAERLGVRPHGCDFSHARGRFPT